MVAKLSLLNMPYTVFLLNSKMEGVVLNRIGTLGLFCLKQRQGLPEHLMSTLPQGKVVASFKVVKSGLTFYCHFKLNAVMRAHESYIKNSFIRNKLLCK